MVNVSQGSEKDSPISFMRNIMNILIYVCIGAIAPSALPKSMLIFTYNVHNYIICVYVYNSEVSLYEYILVLF